MSSKRKRTVKDAPAEEQDGSGEQKTKPTQKKRAEESGARKPKRKNTEARDQLEDMLLNAQIAHDRLEEMLEKKDATDAVRGQLKALRLLVRSLKDRLTGAECAPPLSTDETTLKAAQALVSGDWQRRSQHMREDIDAWFEQFRYRG